MAIVMIYPMEKMAGLFPIREALQKMVLCPKASKNKGGLFPIRKAFQMGGFVSMATNG